MVSPENNKLILNCVAITRFDIVYVNWLYSCLPYGLIPINIQHDMANDMKRSGGRLNKKDGLTRYGDSHVKDKTS